MQATEFTNNEVEEIIVRILEVLRKTTQEKKKPTLSQKIKKALGLTGY